MKSSSIRLGLGVLCASSLVVAAWAQQSRRADSRLKRRDVITKTQTKAEANNEAVIKAARDAGIHELARLIERGQFEGIDLGSIYKLKAEGDLKETIRILSDRGLVDIESLTGELDLRKIHPGLAYATPSVNGRFITGAGGDECPGTAVGDGSYGDDLANYTGSTGDDTSCATGDTVDSWYEYTASCTGTATADTCAGATDTTLAVFDACGGTQLACNDDSGCPSNASTVSWAVTAGNTYQVRVSGWNGSTPTYLLDISCAGPVCGDGNLDAGETCDDGNTADGDCCSGDCLTSNAPGEDECGGRTAVGDGLNAYTTTCATDSADDTCDGNMGSDVWYNYTASCTGIVSVDTCDGDGDGVGDDGADTVLEIFDGCGCPTDQANVIACDDDTSGCGASGFATAVSFNATAGNCYKIRVGDWNGGEHDGNLNISCSPEFCGDGIVNGAEECDDAGESATCDADCTFAVCGDGTLNAAAGEACDDGNTASGDCCDSACQSEGPGNDECGGRTAVADGSNAFDNACASDSAETACDGNMGADIWYNYTATCTGTIAVNTCGAANDGPDTVLEIYDGCGCPADPGTSIGCADDSPGCGVSGFASSIPSTPVVAGNCYKIRVGGWNGGDAAGDLNITCTAGAPTGGCCDGAGACTIETEADCNAAGGTYLGDGSDCSGTCPATNTSCDDRIVIDCSSGTAQESVNTCAGGPVGASSCNTGAGGGGLFESVFYEIVPQGGDVTIATDINSTAADSSYVLFQVDNGDPCNQALWTEVPGGCSEDEGAGFLGNITISGLDAANTYVLQLGSWSAGDCGDYVLDVTCATGFCGDGSVGAGEECDDGNTDNGDGCDSNCIVEECGNGIVQAGEACDDGNTNEADLCNSSCEPLTACCVAGACQTLLYADCDAAGGIRNDFAVCDPALGPTPICVQDQCSYDNGTFIGSGFASSWIPDFATFITTADDFVLRDDTSNPCQINNIRFWAFHFNEAGGDGSVTPADWTNMDLVIYADAAGGGPAGQNDDDGSAGHTCTGFSGCPVELLLAPGDWVATQLDASNPPDGVLDDFWQIDIAVDFELQKNTRYWLEVRPHQVFGGGGQVAWALSANANENGAYQTAGAAVGGSGLFGPTSGHMAFQITGGKVAVCGNGSIEPGEDCDGGDCCSSTCTFEAAGTECRAAAGDCDVAEACDGASADCPADAVEAAGTECRASAGVCDVAEACDGTSVDCPADGFDSGTECRASAGACDIAESCDGTGADCPADAFSTAECRAAAGDCDVAEFCDGATADCPADAVADGSTECRPSTGACDPAESCDGAGVDCPADTTITSCVSGDGCCLPGCNNNNDSDCPAVCGNGAQEAGEECDDGNNDDGDGCAADCTSEFVPNVPTLSQWGMIALMLALGGCIVVVAGRRRETATR